MPPIITLNEHLNHVTYLAKPNAAYLDIRLIWCFFVYFLI